MSCVLARISNNLEYFLVKLHKHKKTLQPGVFLRFLCLFHKQSDKIHLHLTDTTAEHTAEAPALAIVQLVSALSRRVQHPSDLGAVKLPPNSKSPVIIQNTPLILVFLTSVPPS